MVDFTHTVLGGTGLYVHRLGLSASYRPGKEIIYKAFDEGINYFFAYGFDNQMVNPIREIAKNYRDKVIIATGAYNLIICHQNIRSTVEKRLRQLKTDYIDIFLFLGVMKPKQFPEQVREELYRLRDEGKIKYIGMSCHDRKFAGEMAENGDLDTVMIRYNAAHRGAEEDIFPYIKKHDTGVISYTATRWTYLIRRTVKDWPKSEPIPTPGLCYRFVLSNPNVHVCMTAPSNAKQFKENLKSLNEGPLSNDEMDFIKRYGDAVHSSKKWFM
jgi:aryl-alcohol dehydrogenase-like predicted oxidoreductase